MFFFISLYPTTAKQKEGYDSERVKVLVDISDASNAEYATLFLSHLPIYLYIKGNLTYERTAETTCMYILYFLYNVLQINATREKGSLYSKKCTEQQIF